MEANELRIGNLVLVDNKKHHPVLKDRILMVIGIKLCEGIEPITFKKNIKYSISINTTDNPLVEYDYNQYLEFIKPILLNDVWFLKCGLLNTNGLSFLLGCYEIVLSKDKAYYCVLLRGGVIARINYVHQLQNLYFALRGKELTIKL